VPKQIHAFSKTHRRFKNQALEKPTEKERPGRFNQGGKQMINSAATESRAPFLRVLTEDQIWEIKRTALEKLKMAGEKKLTALDS